MPGIGDRAGDHPGAQPRRITPHAGEALSRLVLVVELGEVAAVLAGDRGPEARAGVDALLETVEPLQHVARPADRFAELAVADDVDAEARPAAPTTSATERARQSR